MAASRRRSGAFIVLEGADGVGKSTQACLLADRLRQEGSDVLLIREPGGTPLGERIREVLLDRATGDIDPAAEMFLFMAARAHLMSRRIVPAIRDGKVVVCDRYLWSSVVYQGIVGGLGVENVLEAGRLAGALLPARTYIIDLPQRTAQARKEGRGPVDRMESRGRTFQEKVRRGFLRLARRFPRGTAVIDGDGTPEEVHRRVLARLPAGLIPGKAD